MSFTVDDYLGWVELNSLTSFIVDWYWASLAFPSSMLAWAGVRLFSKNRWNQPIVKNSKLQIITIWCNIVLNDIYSSGADLLFLRRRRLISHPPAWLRLVPQLVIAELTVCWLLSSPSKFSICHELPRALALIVRYWKITDSWKITAAAQLWGICSIFFSSGSGLCNIA